MDKETKAFMKTVQRRVKDIPGYMAQGLYQPSTPIKSALMNSLCRVFITREELVNPQYVEQAAKKALDGEPVIVASAHRSNGDNGSIPYTIGRYGFRKFVKSWVFMMGIKMWEDPFTRSLQGCLNTILTIAPTENQFVRNLMDHPEIFGLGEREISLLQKYRALKEGLIKTGTKVAGDTLKQGNPLFVYPESTRAKDNYLQKAPREVGVLFMGESAWVLPLAVEGTQNIFPVGSPIPRHRGPVTVTAGELIRSDELVSKYRQQRGEHGRSITVADHVMARIAKLDPDRVRDEDWALYRKLLS